MLEAIVAWLKLQGGLLSLKVPKLLCEAKF